MMHVLKEKNKDTEDIYQNVKEAGIVAAQAGPNFATDRLSICNMMA